MRRNRMWNDKLHRDTRVYQRRTDYSETFAREFRLASSYSKLHQIPAFCMNSRRNQFSYSMYMYILRSSSWSRNAEIRGGRLRNLILMVTLDPRSTATSRDYLNESRDNCQPRQFEIYTSVAALAEIVP